MGAHPGSGSNGLRRESARRRTHNSCQRKPCTAGRPATPSLRPLHANKHTHTHTTPSILVLGFLIAGLVAPLHGEQVSLQSLVTPSTIIQKDRQPVTFA